VEKLRTALEKKTTGFIVCKQENICRSSAKRESLSRRNDSKLARPFAGCVEDADQLHNVAVHAIGNYVRRSRDD
jgi:hypothetical protein